MNKVRAGKDLTPEAWPNGSKVAVALSFDFDAETNALRDNNISPGIFSQGEYAARAAVPRILSLLDDYPYFGFSRYSSIRPHIKPMDVLTVWAAEFDKAYEEGTLFILTMHPKYIGHRSRILMLDKLIGHLKSYGDVWFATHADIARHVKKNDDHTK